MAEEPLGSTKSPSGSRRRHGARHPAGAEEDWELSSDDERAAGARAVMTAGGSPLRRARAPVGKRRSLAEIEGYPTWSEDLPALLDLSLWRQGVLASRSAALVALMALLAYSTVLAPAALPSWRDEARLALTLGYQNAVVFSLMAASALQPLVMAPLMMPAMRSANKVPLWPFLAASPLLGSYALLSYLAVFKPPRRVPRLPPGAAELSRGAGGAVLRITEGRALPALLLAALSVLAAVAGAANAATWAGFRALVAASRSVHVAAVHLAAAALIAATVARRDARLRGARGGRLAAATALAALPLFGPAAYLLLRPAATLTAAAPTRRGRAASRAPRRVGAAEPAGAAYAYPPPPAGGPRGGGALGVLRAALLEAPRAVAAFFLSVLVVLMPSRVRLRRQLSAARRHIRRVASFVFQGSHIERNRVPVRQFSVRSDHGVQEDSDPDHPNALAAETLDAVARLHALEEEEEDRLARRGGPGRGRGGAGRAWREIDLTGLGFRRAGRDDEASEDDEEEGVEVEEVAVEEVEEQITEDEYEDEDEEREEEEEEVVLRQYSEEVVEAEIETKATARRSGAAANGTGAALKGAHGPPTPALYYDPRGGGLAPRGALGDYAPAAGEVRESPGGSPGASGGTRGSRAAKQAAIAAIHQLAVSEHPRASM